MGGKAASSVVTSHNVGEKRVVARINVGASGAVSSVNGDGVSFSRVSAGKYTATFKKSFKKLVGFNGSVLNASSSSRDKLRVNVADESYTDSSPTLSVLVQPGDSTTLTDATSGDALLLEFVFLESQVSV